MAAYRIYKSDCAMILDGQMFLAAMYLWESGDSLIKRKREGEPCVNTHKRGSERSGRKAIPSMIMVNMCNTLWAIEEAGVRSNDPSEQ